MLSDCPDSRPDNMITHDNSETQIMKLCVKTSARTRLRSEDTKPSSGFCSISDSAVTKYEFIICGPIISSGKVSA